MSSTLTFENVLYQKKGAIAYVIINRPKVLNALNQKTWENLRAAFEDACGVYLKVERIDRCPVWMSYPKSGQVLITSNNVIKNVNTIDREK